MYSKTLERWINKVNNANAKIAMYGAEKKFDKEHGVKKPWKKENKLLVLVVLLVILAFFIGYYYASKTIIIPSCNCTLWY